MTGSWRRHPVSQGKPASTKIVTPSHQQVSKCNICLPSLIRMLYFLTVSFFAFHPAVNNKIVIIIPTSEPNQNVNMRKSQFCFFTLRQLRERFPEGFRSLSKSSDRPSNSPEPSYILNQYIVMKSTLSWNQSQGVLDRAIRKTS